MNPEQHLFNLNHLDLRLAPTAKTNLKVKVKVFRKPQVCPKINNMNRRMEDVDEVEDEDENEGEDDTSRE